MEYVAKLVGEIHHGICRVMAQLKVSNDVCLVFVM